MGKGDVITWPRSGRHPAVTTNDPRKEKKHTTKIKPLISNYKLGWAKNEIQYDSISSEISNINDNNEKKT
jgi:hypothetical protein